MSNISSVNGGSLNPNAIKQSIERNTATQEEKIDRVGDQFEAVLLRQYLGDSLKPMFKGYLDEGGSINDTYRYFMVDILADSMSAQGAFGLGDKLSAQMSAQDSRQSSSEGSAQPELSGDIRHLNSISKTNGTPNAKH